jgi:hypothetical protein
LGNFNPPTTLSPTPGTDYSGRIFEAPGTTISSTTQGYLDGPAWIEIKLSDYPNFFADPTTITTAYTTDSDSPLDSATYNMNSPDGITRTTGGWTRAGIYMGWSKSPDNPYKVPACAAIWPNYATSSAKSTASVTFFPNEPLPWIQVRDANMFFNIPLKIYLQYEDTTTAGVWHTYEELHNVYTTRGGSTSGDAYMEASDPAWTAWSTVPAYMPAPTTPNGPPGLNIWKGVWGSAATLTTAFPNTMDTYVQNLLDPRSVRQNLATQRGAFYTTGGTGVSQMVNCNYASTGSASKGVPTGFHFVNPATPTGDAAWPSFAVTWVDNVSVPPTKNWDNTTSSRTTYYRDRDYVPRVGDAAGWPSASPLTTGVFAQRPLQLNRPFRSVAELGYVFRDDPWKTLNLFSANSADSSLLDFFCIGPSSSSTPTVPAPDIIAGKLNINSAIANAVSGGNTTTSPVLQALISQTLRDYKSSSSLGGDATTINNSVTTTADITGLATSTMTYMKMNGPLINIGDLGGVFPQVPASTAPTPLYTGLKNPSEALVRAFADSSGTRTWNLMIDVVAQAGKFSPTASNLNNFTVEGEKHYWLHVAIDRFTGEIVDQQLEPVWE